MTKPRHPKPQDIEVLVNEYIDKHRALKRLGVKVLPGTAQHGEFGWSLVVGSEKNPKNTFQFVSELVDVTEELLDDKDIDVILAPSSRRPSEMVK